MSHIYKIEIAYRCWKKRKIMRACLTYYEIGIMKFINLFQWCPLYYMRIIKTCCTIICQLKRKEGRKTFSNRSVQYSAMQWQCTVQCCAVQCSAVQCSAVQCRAVQGNAVCYKLCSAVQHTKSNLFYNTTRFFAYASMSDIVLNALAILNVIFVLNQC